MIMVHTVSMQDQQKSCPVFGNAVTFHRFICVSS
jgi:hypothetical protein